MLKVCVDIFFGRVLGFGGQEGVNLEEGFTISDLRLKV